MARFMISMPDEMVKKLDDAARKEHRSRSELLREAARRHLAAGVQAKADQGARSKAKKESIKKTASRSLRQHLLDLGVGAGGCPGLDRLVGPVNGGVDKRRLLKIAKKLTGLSQDIIASREDRW